ncbi:MAG: alkaline phosphatase, partial [Parvularculaceae bacterium]
MIRLLAIVFSLALSACASASAPPEKNLMVYGDRLFVDAAVEGVPVEALLDSGAEISLADKAWAEETGLETAGSDTAKGTGGSAEVTFAENISVAALGVRLEGLTIAVLDLSDISNRLVGRPVHFIMGRELFDRERLTIDIEEGRIEVISREPTPAGVELKVTNLQGLATVKSRVNGVEADADFDLGNGSGVLIGRAFSKERFHFERMRHIGYQSTHSLDSLVTDSAAASSAWACGEKFRNGEVSYHQDSEASPRTILEMARNRGWSTGLVATSTITHATPAAFAAHVADRGCEQEIARQYIMETKVDILLGAGRGMFNSGEEDADPCGTWGNLIPAAAERGYRIVRTREEMLRAGDCRRLLGLFRTLSLTPTFNRNPEDGSDSEPTLAEMARVALASLEKNPEGFFLVVEGSQIDWANHANHLEYQVKEIQAFDQAVATVQEWIAADPDRESETLVIVVPDHDCGGFAITGPQGHNVSGPGELVKGKWLGGGQHTAE